MDDIGRREFLLLGIGLAGSLAANGLSVTPRKGENSNQNEANTPIRVAIKDNILSLHASWCEILDWRPAIEVGGELLQTADARIELIREEPFHVRLRFSKRQLTWDLQGETDAASNRLLLHSMIRNESQNDVPLGRVFLLQTDKVGGFSRPGDEIVYLPLSASGALNQVQNLTTKKITSDIAIQAFNQSQSKAFQAGFVTFLRAQTQVEHQYTSAKSLGLTAWCDFDGWELSPGSSTPTETLTMAVGENPHLQLEAWSDIAARLCDIRPRQWEEQPNGWLGWSWIDPTYVERYEDAILRNVKSIRQRLDGFGINYVWESIGNLKNGDPGDWLSWNEQHFPNGHKYLHDQLDQMGIKWGLWCGPFMLSSTIEDQVKELWDALVKQPDGKQPMVFLSSWGYREDKDYHKPVYALDPSHPKTLEFVRDVFETYRAWGVRYYMIDFLWAGSDTLWKTPHARHYDKTLVSGPEVFQKGLRAIRDACGDDTHLLASSGPTYHTAGVMDSVRIGNDFGEGRPMASDFFNTYPGTFAVKPPTNWNGPVYALSNQAANYHTHRKLYINNSGNVLTVDKPLQLNLAQVNATVHVMSGGPSMLGDDITYIEEERLGLIKKTLPRPRDVAVPVDLFTRAEPGYPKIYHRRIVKPYGTYDVIAIYNLEASQSIKQHLDLKSIGLKEERAYHVWEFWNTEYLGTVRAHLSVEIPPYTVKVYRLTEDTGYPVVLGTDMHVLMGEVEIDRCNWDSAQQTISGWAIRPAGETGSVFIYGPPKMGVANPKGHFVGKDLNNDCLLIRCPLRFDNGVAAWNVKFYNLAGATTPPWLRWQ